MTPAPLTLYHYWRSSCSWRVRWALNLKGLAYDAVAVNLLAKEQRAPAYLALAPTGQVPCLVHEGRAYVESLPIIEWLDETFPARPILSRDPEGRYRERMLANLIAAGIQPIQNLKVLERFSPDAEARKAWAQHWITEGLRAFAAALPQGPGPFCLGSRPTLPDLCLIPQIYNAKRFDVDVAAIDPRLAAIYAAALASPECQAAAPERFEPKA